MLTSDRDFKYYGLSLDTLPNQQGVHHYHYGI